MEDAVSDAISAALAQNWDRAIEINKTILKNNKDDLETLCRLAYAYLQYGEIDKAKKLYKKILAADRYNCVAQKNYLKIANLSGTHIKTNIISKLSIGDTVQLNPKKHAIEVRGIDKTYYGAIPDDVTFRLLKFIEAGNTYLVCIKNIQKNYISVFIREMSRGKKLNHQPSFSPASLKYFATTIRKEIKKGVLPEEHL